ncbi:MAG: putative endoribonuclease [Gemmatimonadetes bacterium]|nr:putative endoribonuclease [Gemmatimonadota bacterium]
MIRDRARLTLFALVGLLGACATHAGPMVEFHPSPSAGGPFSPSVRVGDLLFLSGVIGIDSTGKMAPGGVRPEARLALENLKAELARQGLGLDRVVKCTVIMADMADWPAMNEVYVTFFPGVKPARTAFAASQLIFNARLELDCVAAVR